RAPQGRLATGADAGSLARLEVERPWASRSDAAERRPFRKDKPTAIPVLKPKTLMGSVMVCFVSSISNRSTCIRRRARLVSALKGKRRQLIGAVLLVGVELVHGRRSLPCDSAVVRRLTRTRFSRAGQHGPAGWVAPVFKDTPTSAREELADGRSDAEGGVV